MFDVLSCLLNKIIVDVTNKIEILNVLYKYLIKLTNEKFRTIIIQNLSTITYYVILIKVFNDFKNKLKIVYLTNNY